jgi:mono/diheme cytochrome c family protein
MSFNPQTGLVYFSATENSMVMKTVDRFEYRPMATNLGILYPAPPELLKEVNMTAPAQAQTRLLAWDPVRQREVWRSGVLGTQGSGTLSTAGGLVFQGTADSKKFVAYRATDGKELWSTDAQTGVVAAAASYEIEGEQYIAVEAGYGLARYGMSNGSRLLVFKLGGNIKLPPAPPPPPPLVLDPPPSTASREVIERGHQRFADRCAICHEPPSASRAVFPDLRYSPTLRSAEAFSAIVIGGALQANGMASFRNQLSEAEVQAIRAYVIARANDAKVISTP